MSLNAVAGWARYDGHDEVIAADDFIWLRGLELLQRSATHRFLCLCLRRLERRLSLSLSLLLRSR